MTDRIKILVIEDALIDFTIIEMFLKKNISQPIITHSVTYQSAVAHLTAASPLFDIILLDLNLPDNSGEPLVQSILEHSGNCPVVILTGFDDLEFSMHSITKGVSDYILKPELSGAILHKSIIYAIERQKNYIKLKESEKKYITLFESSPQPKCIYETDTFKFLQVNDASKKYYGYTDEEYKSMTLLDLVPPEDIPAIKAYVASQQREVGKTYTGRFRTYKKDGYLIDVETYSTPLILDNKAVTLLICLDITEKIKAERDLKESNQRYNYLTKATSDAIWDWNLATGHVYWGEGFETIFGYKIAEIPNNISFKLNNTHVDDKVCIEKHMESLFTIHDSNIECQYRFLRADNTYAHVIDKAFILRDEHGKITRIVGGVRDITKKKEEELRLKLLESVITNTNDTVVITEIHPDDEMNPSIVYVNEAFTTLTGYTVAEALGKNPRFLQGPKTDKNELAKIRTAIKKRQSCDATLINYKKNGETFWVNISITPITDRTGNFTHWIAIQRDVTEKKIHESEIMKAIIKTQEAERYEIGAELHDNVCQILVSSLMWLKRTQKQLEAEELQYFNNGLENILDATREIRNISHRIAPAFHEDTTLEETFKNLIRTFSLNTNIQVNLSLNCAFSASILKHEFQLTLYRIMQEQMRNIVKHAHAKVVSISCKIEQDKVRLTITDDGVGLSANCLKNGIGFSNMKRRTELFMGKFEVISAPQKGCTIIAEVPLQEVIAESKQRTEILHL